MEILQWMKDHESEVGVTFTQFNDRIDITMYNHKTRFCNRMTIDYYELNDMDNKKIIDILDLMYEELLKENING